MGKGTFRLGTIAGIELKAHWGWLLILLFFTWQLGSDYFPQRLPDGNPVEYYLLGFLAAILLFVSVLLHEFSHSLVARARGYSVRDITLFIFGGVSNITEEAKKPSDEFLISVVGPLTSFVLGVIFGGLAIVFSPQGSVGMGATSLLQYMALINLVLALFNMIPGFPLDGGRVLRSIIWVFTRNIESATRIAGVVGQLVAYTFIAWGLLRIFGGDFFGGAWIGFIGWFLLMAAQQSTTGVAVRQAVRGITVAQLMQPSPPAAPRHITLAHLLTVYILPYNLRALPVVDQDGRVVGLVALSDIRDVPQDQWGIVTVDQVMTGGDKLRVVRPQDSLEQALQFLMEADFDQLPVVDAAGRLVGVLSRAHVLRWMQIRDEMNVQPGSSQGQSPPPSPAGTGTQV